MAAMDKEGNDAARDSTLRKDWFYPYFVVTVTLKISLVPDGVSTTLSFLLITLLGVLSTVQWGCSRNALTDKIPLVI